MGFRDDLASMPLGTPIGGEAPPPVQGPPAPGPTFGQQLTSAFRQNNMIVSALANRVNPTRDDIDPDFDLWNYVKGTEREQHWRRYVDAGAFNQERATGVDQQLAMEDEDKKILAAMPWYQSLMLGVAAGVTDPTVLLPGGGAIRAAKGGYSVVRSALMTGTAASAAIAVQEGALQQSQLTRGWEESAINIGGGFVLGALLGGGVASVLNKADQATTLRAAGLAYGGEMPSLAPALSTEELLTRLNKAQTDFLMNPVNTGDPTGRAALAATIDALPDDVKMRYMAHGTDVKGAVNILENGIDRERQFFAGDLAGQGQGVSAKTFSDVVLIYEDTGATKLKAVAVSDAIAELIPELAKKFPEVNFYSSREIGQALQSGVFDSAAKTPSALANPGSLSAATTTGLPPEATRIKGSFVERLGGKFGWLVPNIRAAQRTSAYAREIAQLIAENPFIMRGNAEGLTAAPGGAASRQAATMEARFPNTVAKQDAIYKEMIQSGLKMKYEEFGDRIGYALINGTKDLEGNEFINRAAQIWRKEFYDSFFKDAVAAGALTENQALRAMDNLDSYLPRQPIREAFAQYRDEWLARAMPWWEEHLADNYQKSLEKVRERLAVLEQKRADLQLTPEDAAKLIAELQGQSAALDAAYPELMLARETLRDINSAMAKARKAGDTALLERLRAERDSIRADPAVAAFNKEQEALLRRERAIMRGELGVNEAARKIGDQLADIEERAVRQLEKLIERGRATERKFQSIAPEKYEPELEKLRLAYQNVVEREEQALAKLQERITKIEAQYAKKLDEANRAAIRERAAFTDYSAADPGAVKKSAEELRLEAEQDRLIADKLAAEEARAEGRVREMRRIQDRIDTIDAVDRYGIVEAIREANDMLVRAVANRQLSAGERAQRLKDRLARRTEADIAKDVAALDAKIAAQERRFYDRWETQAMGKDVDIRGTGAPNFKELAREISEELADKYSNRQYGEAGGPKSEFGEIITKGPFKGRTNPMPDMIMDPPGAAVKFFNKNVNEVSALHARRFAGDIALARLNLGGPAMREVFGEVGEYAGKLKESYDAIRKQIDAAETAQEALAVVRQDPTMSERLSALLGNDTTDVTKRRLYQFLVDDEAGARTDLELLRDTVRATAYVDENSTSFGRIARVTTGFNYIRSMGGQGLSMLTDLYRPAMVRGLGAFMTDGIAPLLTNLSAVKMSVEEAKLANLVTNRVADHILLTMADIGDPLAKGTPIERIMDKLTRVGSRLNGSRILQDFAETVGSTMTQTHVLRTISDPAARAANIEYLTHLGITPSYAERMAAQFAKYGEDLDGVLIANTQKWDDEVMVRAYRSAIGKEVDTMFSTRRARPGDVPFFMQTPLGKLLLQFNSFNISSFSNVLLRGLQGDKIALAQGVVAMTSMGMLVRYLQAVSGGNERLERFQRNAQQNPGFWIAEGLDAGGIFALPFYAANTVEAAFSAAGAGRINPIKTPIMSAVGPVPTDLQTITAGRDILTQVGGPTAGLISNLPRAMGAAVDLGTGVSPSKQRSSALQQVLPGGTYIGFRQLIQALNGDLPGR